MKMKGSKILAMLVVLAMLTSTIILFVNVKNEKGIAKAATMGVDDFQGSPSGANILNMTEDELELVKSSGSYVELKFNGTLINANNWVYKPIYTGSTDSPYTVWVNWTKLSDSLDYDVTTPTKTVLLDTAGLWLVVPDVPTTGSMLYKVNMSSMKVYDGTSWVGITGWFWVNSSSWTVTLSEDIIYYDRNDSLTITVKDASGNALTAQNGFIDIWNIADGVYSLVWHKYMPKDETNGMVWEIENMYSYTHSKGAGTYAVTAYGYPFTTTEQFNIYKAIYGKGESGGSGHDGEYGYNSTFGNPASYCWDGRFTSGGATYTVILNGYGARVYTTTYFNTTYKYATCGPFAPPRYWSGYENFTVAAGVPKATITNGSQFWNDSADNEVYINVTNYAGHSLNFNGKTILLYNNSNDPSKTTSIPISSNNYNKSVGLGYIKITPRGPWNRWGYNTSSSTTWAPKKKVYVVYAMDTLGNDSEEWNGTSFFTLTSAAARFVWVDDDGVLNVDTKHTDGVLPKIPAINQVPLSIKFKIQGDDYSYWGAGTAGETVTEAAENITISGNSLFTGTLDQFPGYADTWFDGTDTWTVPIIPTMSQGGGEITFTAVAWNKTLTADLTIGGGDYLKNGSIVTVTPSEFNIGAEDQTLTTTVKRADGITNNPFGTVYLYYLEDDGTVANEIDYVTTTTETYSMTFNKTQQTTNQTGTTRAPRNLIIYVDATNSGYGYALIKMKPESDLKVTTSKSTILAGYNYDDFYINTTVIDATGNSTGTPDEDDEASFFVVIYDEDDNNVTDTLISSGGIYDYTDLRGDSSSFDEYSFDLTNLYITEPGTYTIYAYNNTHNSEGYNATLVVKQVEVTCDKTPLIWRYDDNISATFTVTYDGIESVSGGALVIDNMTTCDDYNKTWVNTSFNGATDDNLFNDSIELDEDAGFVDGIVTVNDITANYLESGEAEQYITFWFKPEDGEYARALGVLPVSVPSVATDKTKVSLGQTTTVVATVTGRGTALEDVFVGLHGCGITIATTNGTTGSDGTVTFSILPTSTGTIKLDVGEEGRVTDTTITVTSWAIDIAVDAQVDETTDFTVTVTKKGTSTPVEGAYVTFSGVTGTKTTSADGKVTFTAPEVNSDRQYTISVTAEGYTPASTTITVINIPKLIISVDAEVVGGSTFEVSIAKDTGDPVIGATVTFEGKTYKTKAGGVATLTAPSTAGEYEITATFGTFTPATATITVTKPEGGIPGFELVTLVIAIGVALILLRRRRN
jgi:hypothetical protein